MLKAYDIHRDKDDGFCGIPHINILRMKVAKHGGMTFQSLVSGSRPKQCTKPVDRLWGMLGMVHPHIRKEISSLASIDYSKDGGRHFWRQFIALAKWRIKDDPTLMLLFKASSRVKPEELPPWCPDWTSAEECFFLVVYSAT